MKPWRCICFSIRFRCWLLLIMISCGQFCKLCANQISFSMTNRILQTRFNHLHRTHRHEQHFNTVSHEFEQNTPNGCTKSFFIPAKQRCFEWIACVWWLILWIGFFSCLSLVKTRWTNYNLRVSIWNCLQNHIIKMYNTVINRNI